MTEIEIGQRIVLNKDQTYIFGDVEGWRVDGQQLIEVLISGIREPFRVFGEDCWAIVIEEEENGSV